MLEQRNTRHDPLIAFARYAGVLMSRNIMTAPQNDYHAIP